MAAGKAQGVFLGPVLTQSQPWGWGNQACLRHPCPLFMDGVGTPLTAFLTPPAAQEARNKFEEAERSLKDMEESIRYGGTHAVTARPLLHCPMAACCPTPQRWWRWRSHSGNLCKLAVAPAGRVPRQRGLEPRPRETLRHSSGPSCIILSRAGIPHCPLTSGPPL